MSYLRFSYGLSGRIATVNSRVIDRKNFWPKILVSKTFSFFYIYFVLLLTNGTTYQEIPTRS